jgi:hypothetical protein
MGLEGIPLISVRFPRAAARCYRIDYIKHMLRVSACRGINLRAWDPSHYFEARIVNSAKTSGKRTTLCTSRKGDRCVEQQTLNCHETGGKRETTPLKDILAVNLAKGVARAAMLEVNDEGKATEKRRRKECAGQSMPTHAYGSTHTLYAGEDVSR